MWPFKPTLKKPTHTDAVSLYWQDNSLFMAIGKKTSAGTLSVTAAQSLFSKEKSLVTQLKEAVEKYQLQQAPTTILLSAPHFELFLLDALPVEDAEIHNALQWRLRDLITYPLQEACWDFFQIPTQDARKYILCVIVCRKTWLNKIVAEAQACTLIVKNITIPSLALRNLLSLYPDDAQGIGLLFHENNVLKLILVKNQILYLLRLFNTPIATQEANPTQLDELALFVQRSLDYYQSQLHQPAIATLYLMPKTASWLDYLSKNLTCKLALLDLDKCFDATSPIKQVPDEAIISVSGLLTQEALSPTVSTSKTP